MPTLTEALNDITTIESPYFVYYEEDGNKSDHPCAYYAQLPDGLALKHGNVFLIPRGFRLLEKYESELAAKYQDEGFSVKFCDYFVTDNWTECFGIRPSKYPEKVYITNHPIEVEPWRVNFECKLP